MVNPAAWGGRLWRFFNLRSLPGWFRVSLVAVVVAILADPFIGRGQMYTLALAVVGLLQWYLAFQGLYFGWIALSAHQQTRHNWEVLLLTGISARALLWRNWRAIVARLAGPILLLAILRLSLLITTELIFAARMIDPFIGVPINTLWQEDYALWPVLIPGLLALPLLQVGTMAMIGLLAGATAWRFPPGMFRLAVGYGAYVAGTALYLSGALLGVRGLAQLASGCDITLMLTCTSVVPASTDRLLFFGAVLVVDLGVISWAEAWRSSWGAGFMALGAVIYAVWIAIASGVSRSVLVWRGLLPADE